MNDFKLGDRVKHDELGDGTVSDYSCYEESIVVTFDKAFGLNNTNTFGVFVDSPTLI